ncbi:MAG: dephospho-CoA kinase [Bacillota bacterium]|nr:dephospho-CoA kinase [Bacillota bacterium]
MNKDTIIMGLTGGIGTGKSTASEYLKSKGFVHIDADAISRSITADGSPVLDTLNKVFGPDGEMGVEGHNIIDESGSLMRQALADIVFVDSAKTKRLDEIMLSQIISIIDDKVKRYRESCDMCRVLLDAPLLFESGLDSRCDKVMVIVADKDTRISRVEMRDGISAKQIQERIDNQMDDVEKVSKADYVIDNSGALGELYEQLDKIVKKL